MQAKRRLRRHIAGLVENITRISYLEAPVEVIQLIRDAYETLLQNPENAE